MIWNLMVDKLPEKNQQVVAIMMSGRMVILTMNEYRDLFDDQCGNWNIEPRFVRMWSEAPENPMDIINGNS